MAQIEIGQETEGPNRWSYDVTVHDEGKTYTYDVTLSWSDYDLWSRGRVAPERVVKAAFNFLLSKESADSILSKFDCALIRRYFPEVDSELPGML